MRKERDELWAEADRLRGEVAGLQHERNEMSAKLVSLRGEVKYTMDDVVQDRWGGGGMSRTGGQAGSCMQAGEGTLCAWTWFRQVA